MLCLDRVSKKTVSVVVYHSKCQMVVFEHAYLPAEAEQKVATTLEELRAQHQKELMVLQLQHQKALQEQERKLLEQQQLQQQQMLKGKATLKPTGQPEKATGGKNGKRGGKGGSKSGTPPVPPPSTTSSQVSKQTGSKENKSVAAAPTGSILASANKTLAEAAKKPGHQVRSLTQLFPVAFSLILSGTPLRSEVNRPQWCTRKRRPHSF